MITRTNTEHPRLFYGKKEIEALKKAAESSAEIRQEIDKIREKCEKLMTRGLLTEEYANSVYSQHGNFYEIGSLLTDFAESFTIMYLLGEDKYVPKMKEALLYYADFAAWTGPANKDRKIPWHSDLSTTRILYGFAVAYDGMYGEFTDEERALIRGAMMKLGINPLLTDWLYDGTRIHALDSMGHNWWSVCTAFAGIGLCAIYDEVDGSMEILENVMRSMRMFCEYEGDALLNKVANFDSKGMFYESCNYFNYGIGELCRFLFAWRRCFEDEGESRFPVLDKVPSAYLSMVYPTSGSERNLHVNFGDSPLSGSGFIGLPRYLILLGCGGENLKRYYNRAKQNRDILDLLYPEILDSWDGKSPEYPKTELFPDTGLAFLRSSDKEDAVMLAVRCGFTWNHAHDDAGSFILFKNGETVLMDSGTVNYGRSDYTKHYCSGEAHNIVTVNGKAQFSETNYRGNKFPGKIPHFMEDGELAYLLADATGPMCDACMRNHRSFIRLCEDIFVIIDDLYTYADSEFAWLLHYSGSMTEEVGRMVIESEKNRLAVTTVTPQNYSVERRSHDDREYAAIKFTEKSRICQIMSVISPTDAEIKRIGGEGWYGCEIRYGGRDYRVCYNMEADGRRMHVNSNNTVSGYDTDAYILCEVGEKIMMVYGSYLRKGGGSVYENLKKEFVIL